MTISYGSHNLKLKEKNKNLAFKINLSKIDKNSKLTIEDDTGDIIFEKIINIQK